MMQRLLAEAEPASLGLAACPLARLDELIRAHIEERRYPGCQIAIARHGTLAVFRSYGIASTEPRIEVASSTLWLLYSGTKVITTMALWSLGLSVPYPYQARFIQNIINHLRPAG